MKTYRIILAALAIVLSVASADRANAQASVAMYCWNPNGSNATNNQFVPCQASNPLQVQGSISASLSPFTPSLTGARGTPLSVTTSDSSGSLPTNTGSVVVYNVGANPMYCNVNGIAATTADQYISSSGGWFDFGIPVGTTTLHCIATGGTTTANTAGGTGLGSGTGGGSGGGGGGGTVTQGPAAAITGGWPVIDGAGTDTTGTLTSGSGTVNATIDGYASVKVQFKGTYAGFTFTTNVSSDGGTTFVPIQCALIDGSQFGSSFTLTANQSTELACGHQSGDDTFQISAASGPATGTANIDISPSAFPSGDGQTIAIGKILPLTPVSTASIAANQVIKSSASALSSFNVSADSTLSGAAWWIMVYNATSAPADGAVTPTKCYAMTSGTSSFSTAWLIPVVFSTGITIGVSTTGCFTKTASTHAFISGDAQ